MWFKVSDNFPRHPKTFASARALGGPLKRARGRVVAVWTEAGCHCSEFLTDGFVDEAQLLEFTTDDDPKKVAEALVAGGLWSKATGGYRFHDWEHHNPPASTIKEKRERDRLRKAGKLLPAANGIRGEVIDGELVESAPLLPLLAAESDATGTRNSDGIAAESGALARARSRPVPSPRRSRAEDRGALTRRPTPARLRLNIWQVRPNVHAAVHALIRTGAPFVDAEGRPNERELFERVRDIVANDLKADYDQSRELQSIIDSALGQYASEREAGLALEAFHRSERKSLDQRVRRNGRLG